MTARLTAIVALATALLLGACTDPRSPIPPGERPPTAGIVLDRRVNRYDDPNGPEYISFYYLRVNGATELPHKWVQVDRDEYRSCQVGETWIGVLNRCY